MGRGGRWIVQALNVLGTTLRGAKFSNGSLAGLLGRITYTGVYYDKTADDDGNVPGPEDWIAVSCPAIIRAGAVRPGQRPARVAQSAPYRAPYRCGHDHADGHRQMRDGGV